jgi:hypothetical protein
MRGLISCLEILFSLCDTTHAHESGFIFCDASFALTYGKPGVVARARLQVFCSEKGMTPLHATTVRDCPGSRVPVHLMPCDLTDLPIALEIFWGRDWLRVCKMILNAPDLVVANHCFLSLLTLRLSSTGTAW